MLFLQIKTRNHLNGSLANATSGQMTGSILSKVEGSLRLDDHLPAHGVRRCRRYSLLHFHCTAANIASQRQAALSDTTHTLSGWSGFFFSSRTGAVQLLPEQDWSGFLNEHPPDHGRMFSYNRQCRRRESNPHSRREHDFESCASAYSATSAFWFAFASIPLSIRRSR